MDNVPITFDYDGKIYTGHFSRVAGGGGSNVWFLLVDKRYWGQLSLTEDYGWKWSSNSDPGLVAQLDFFERVIVAACG